MTDVCPDKKQLWKGSSKRKCQQNLRANVFLCASTDIYLRYPDDFPAVPRKCFSPGVFCMNCLDSCLSDDITVLSTGIKAPVGSSTQLESLFFSLLLLLFHFSPCFWQHPHTKELQGTDGSKTCWGTRVHPYRTWDSVCGMSKKSSQIFAESPMSPHLCDSQMQLTEWDAEVWIIGQTLFEGEEWICLWISDITIGTLCPGCAFSKHKGNTFLFYQSSDLLSLENQFQAMRSKHGFTSIRKWHEKYVWGTKPRLYRAVLNQISSICALVSQAHV